MWRGREREREREMVARCMMHAMDYGDYTGGKDTMKKEKKERKKAKAVVQLDPKKMLLDPPTQTPRPRPP